MSLFVILTNLLVFILSKINSYSVRSGISMPWDLIRRNFKTSNQENFHKDSHSQNNNYQELFATMKLDHFSPGNSETFKMRVLVSSKYYQEGGPILFYCGNEGPITDFWDVSGFLTDNLAEELNGLVIFAEHRFFGESFPRNQTKQDYDINKNKFLTVEQTLADFSVFLQKFVKEYSLPELTPIIAFGGSYGGMLASWGRMKFPHVYAGAIASSAPILLFEDIDKISNNFFRIATDTFKRYDEKCPSYIRQGFNELFNIRNSTLHMSNHNIINELNDIFKPCKEIRDKDDVALLENSLEGAIIFIAQYNYPYNYSFGEQKMPANPAKVACENANKTIFKRFSRLLTGMESFTFKKYNLMEKDVKNNLMRLKVASDVFFNNTGAASCIDIGNDKSKIDLNGWDFQACTEMIMPMQKKELQICLILNCGI